MGICETDPSGREPGEPDGAMGNTAPRSASAPCPVALYLARLALRSQRTQGQALRVIVGLLEDVAGGPLPWESVRYPHTQAVRSHLVARYRPATANRMLSALRGVLRESWRLGLLSAEDYGRCADLLVVRGSSLPAGRVVTQKELKALFVACARDQRIDAIRDVAVLAVLLGAGLRREEAVRLDVADLNPRTGELRVHGKGDKERQVFAAPLALAALRRWLSVRGVDAGPLLLPVTRGGRLRSRRLTTQAIYYILRRRAGRAQVAVFSPHDLRRTFCTSLLEAGVDIATVAGLMGHASVDTTRRYDRRELSVRRNAVRLLQIPVRS